MNSYDELEKLLTAKKSLNLPPDSRTRAAVAMIVRSDCGKWEVLFIERAIYAEDPWSGNLGFPGGKIETGDTDPRRAAERETMEELGLDLSAARYLGNLGEIAGAHLPVRVSCFVYGLCHPASLKLQNEIKRAFWIPLVTLQDPERRLNELINFGGERTIRPAIRIQEPGKTLLWGLTYRLVCQFLEILDESSNVRRP